MMDPKKVLESLKSTHRSIAERILNGHRISPDEGLVLYEEFELSLLGILANTIRENLNQKFAYFNRNVHLEPTNICIHNCLFCSYSRKINQEGAWEYSIDDIKSRAKELSKLDITEIHIVGGVHPHRTVDYYAEMISVIRKALPDIHIKAFTAAEIEHMAKKAGLSIRRSLEILKNSGLQSLPGGGAEIFNEVIRKKICPDKTSSVEWLNVHKEAHNMGLPTNCTMLYGHIEKYEHRIDHLNRLRTLQDETMGFNAFIPLKYKSLNNELSHIGEVPIIEDLRNYAISRIFLDNIPHIKAYWPMTGIDLALLSLSFGVDDLDGTINDSTKIYSMAGSDILSPDLSVNKLTELIFKTRFIPVERNSIYEAIKIFQKK